MPYEYYSDEVHLRQWLNVEKDEEQFRQFLDKYIYSVKDFTEYLELCGGIQRINELRAQEHLIEVE
jgi:glutaconate CoA-transferase subunit A